ncbi:hypothetical protein BT63DRAFT_149291 [Microthyrium microscopicum]|uniref:Zn(2)-C6 fungal-type domain-containing protein n=1 Tax=Microthyrium microscopicum TaxID=703497 RepID=A0A6A6UQ27_9PEZI|nr:hypothetical protein BT63DRAFT_149291 [Microthyrium microscopicum]
MKPGSLADFTNTFILSASESGSGVVLAEVPKAIDPSRQRKAHRKSRYGCVNCRKRRVKCNEGGPCKTCIRRNKKCHRPLEMKEDVLVWPMTEVSGSQNTAMNSLNDHLFHHFEKHAQNTLIFSADVWANALQLCFKYDFLKNAVLSLSARHLAFLQPKDTTYSVTATSLLCRAIAQLREELSKTPGLTHPDAFIATSILFQFEIWTNTDLARDGVFDPSGEHLFTFNRSLKDLFLRNSPLLSKQSSVLLKTIQHNHTVDLAASAQRSNVEVSKRQRSFSKEFSMTRMMRRDLPCATDASHIDLLEIFGGDIAVYSSVINHICLILSFSPDATTTATGLVSSQCIRYITSFPLTCGEPFAAMVHQSEPYALLLLYHFYHAITFLLRSDQYWWVHKRVTASETIVKACLAR